MNRKLYIYLAMMAIIPIAGELRIYPLEDHLRVSLGTPAFFFFLLFYLYRNRANMFLWDG